MNKIGNILTAGLHSAVGGLPGSIIQGGLNTISAAVSNKLAGKQADENLKRQAQFQKEMYDKYTSPSAQVSALIKAGLNPNLAYDSLGSATPSPTSSADAANTPVGSVDNSSNSLLASQKALNDAQADKVRADKDKTELESIRQAIDNAFAQKQNEVQISLGESTITLNLAKTSETQVNVDAILQNIQATKQNIAESQKRCEQIIQQISNLKEEEKSIILHRALDSAQVRASVQHMLSAANLNNMSAKKVHEEFYQLLMGRERVTLGNIQMQLQNDRLSFDLRSDKRWRDAERQAQNWTLEVRTMSGAFGDVLGALSPFSHRDPTHVKNTYH